MSNKITASKCKKCGGLVAGDFHQFPVCASEFIGKIQSQLSEVAAERDALQAALQAAVDCGMVPNSTVKEGGANWHSIQVKVADQIRAALAATPEK